MHYLNRTKSIIQSLSTSLHILKRWYLLDYKKWISAFIDETTLNKNDIIIVLALIKDTSTYTLHGGNKKAVSPYKILTVSSTVCKTECDKDLDCNGYSINSTGCFLSKCDIYIDVPGCKACKFASKNPPSSSVDCSQTSGMPPSTTMTSQSVTTIGNDVRNLTTYNISCVCVCKDVNQTMEESIQQRRSELLLNKTKLSSAMRKLTSAHDYRKSSEVIGNVSVIILIIIGMLFFFADICSVLSFCLRKCLKIVHLSK